MTHFADPTAYSYLSCNGHDEPWPGVPLLNIGWLDINRPFPTGETPEGLLQALERLAKPRFHQTRGPHFCQFCPRDLNPTAEDHHLIHDLVPAGSAELRIAGNNVVYAAPTLLPHYIAAHSYLPPREFRVAALQAANRTVPP